MKTFRMFGGEEITSLFVLADGKLNPLLRDAEGFEYRTLEGDRLNENIREVLE